MLTQSHLKELLHYSPTTGIFTRLVSAGPAHIGDLAGSINTIGYVQITIDGRKYLAHRLAFLFMDGYFPEYGVDHKNKVRNDNRWGNLHHATQICNMQNCEINSKNTSGFPGVSWQKRDKRWIARATLNYKQINLGYYTDILEAALARYTFEQQCEHWNCVQDSELVKAIKLAWPEFQC